MFLCSVDCETLFKVSAELKLRCHVKEVQCKQARIIILNENGGVLLTTSRLATEIKSVSIRAIISPFSSVTIISIRLVLLSPVGCLLHDLFHQKP